VTDKRLADGLCIGNIKFGIIERPCYNVKLNSKDIRCLFAAVEVKKGVKIPFAGKYFSTYYIFTIQLNIVAWRVTKYAIFLSIILVVYPKFDISSTKTIRKTLICHLLRSRAMILEPIEIFYKTNFSALLKVQLLGRMVSCS